MKTVKTTAQARYYKEPTVITVADHIADKMLANGWATEIGEDAPVVDAPVVDAPVEDAPVEDAPVPTKETQKQSQKKQTKK